MSIIDAAAWAGVSPRTMKRWIEQGLPRYQAGPRSKVLVCPTDIEHFLTRRQSPAPDLDAMVNAVMKDLGG